MHPDTTPVVQATQFFPVAQIQSGYDISQMKSAGDFELSDPVTSTPSVGPKQQKQQDLTPAEAAMQLLVEMGTVRNSRRDYKVKSSLNLDIPGEGCTGKSLFEIASSDSLHKCRFI